jgi:[ribosomal protein S18]-alanine N-acetyltransferase
MPNLLIELARPADAQQLGEMSRDHIETGLGWHYRKDALLQFMTDADTNVAVARLAASAPAIGFAVMRYRDLSAHLVLMAVAPSWRRRGVGRALVNWHIKTARVAGSQSLGVELRADNVPARTFYESLGFAVIQKVEKYYQGSEPALRMMLDLRGLQAAT